MSNTITKPANEFDGFGNVMKEYTENTMFSSFKKDYYRSQHGVNDYERGRIHAANCFCEIIHKMAFEIADLRKEIEDLKAKSNEQ